MARPVKVKGLAQLLAATDKADRQTKRQVRAELRQAAENVRDDASRRFVSYSPVSAGRYGISVRKTGVIAVEQRLRKTSGLRPDFGALQMRKALVPANVAEQAEFQRRLEDALDRIARDFEHGGTI